MLQLPCLRVWEMLLQATFSFPNWFSSWEGPGATLCFGYELISLPEHSMGTQHTWYCLCYEGDQLCSLPLGSSVAGAAQLPRVVASPSDQMGLENTPQWVGLLISSLPGHGQPGSKASKLVV